MRVFLIDDEIMYYKLLSPVLKNAGHILGNATSGKEGLEKVAGFNPDVIILDIRLNDMTGFDLLERFREDPHFSNVPVIFVTGFDELESKLKAFNLGAEDYVTKPFKPEELLARLEVLARRREYIKVFESSSKEGENIASVIALHSLRGGVGCTSLAVNLALAYHELWLKPTLLVDAVFTSGQVALFLNASPKTTWKDLSNQTLDDLDGAMIMNLINMQKNGISYIASPNLPATFESLNDIFPKTLDELRGHHDLIVLDTPHDFSDIAVMSLDAADYVLLVLAPEMASLRAAICALKTYTRLDYPEDKVKIVLNNNSPVAGIKLKQIEQTIGRHVDIEIPFSQEVSRSINTGEPFLIANPELPISMRVEEFAYQLSRDDLKSLPPAAPSRTWKDVTKRLNTNPTPDAPTSIWKNIIKRLNLEK
jgi:pilus assembly protein CpaE